MCSINYTEEYNKLDKSTEVQIVPSIIRELDTCVHCKWSYNNEEYDSTFKMNYEGNKIVLTHFYNFRNIRGTDVFSCCKLSTLSNQNYEEVNKGKNSFGSYIYLIKTHLNRSLFRFEIRIKYYTMEKKQYISKKESPKSINQIEKFNFDYTDKNQSNKDYYENLTRLVNRERTTRSSVDSNDSLNRKRSEDIDSFLDLL